MPEQSNTSDLVGVVPAAKPCPFCGELPAVRETQELGGQPPDVWAACDVCEYEVLLPIWQQRP